MSFLKVFNQGIVVNNGLYRQLLGLCPALAVTGTVVNSLGMGIATTAVLVASNFVISVASNFIPKKIRIPSYIVIIATFVTLIDMLLEAFDPELHGALGIFIPLIVTNCLILGRAEAFASQNGVKLAVSDGLGMGLGFSLALVSLGIVRELLGMGSLLGWPVLENLFAVFGMEFQPVLIFVQPAGAFFALGFLLALVNLLYKKFYSDESS